jgi:hypothetical protein
VGERQWLVGSGYWLERQETVDSRVPVAGEEDRDQGTREQGRDEQGPRNKGPENSEWPVAGVERFCSDQFLGRSGSWNKYAPGGGNDRQTWAGNLASVLCGLRGKCGSMHFTQAMFISAMTSLAGCPTRALVPHPRTIPLMGQTRKVNGL